MLIDNATAHDPTLKGTLSNIEIIFLPKNSTSKLQQLDAGVIKNFKVKYRQHLLTHVLALIDSTDMSASSIAKAVTVLDAIRWTRAAWEDVTASTIARCFKHCGVTLVEGEIEEDPFVDLDLDGKNDEGSSTLEDMVSGIDADVCALEYAEFDTDVATCATIKEGEDWKDKLCSAAIEGMKS